MLPQGRQQHGLLPAQMSQPLNQQAYINMGLGYNSSYNSGILHMGLQGQPPGGIAGVAGIGSMPQMAGMQVMLNKPSQLGFRVSLGFRDAGDA